jgi:prepilin-type N-terminal cleavage/methylation domain-containing protein
MTHRQFRGFTLIELTIVVLILATAIGLTYPAYRSHVILMQVTQDAQLLRSYEPTVRDNTSDSWAYPATLNHGIGMPRGGQYADSFALLTGGIVEITYNGPKAAAPIKGTKLDFAPYTNTRGETAWKCTAPTAPAVSVPLRYWPLFCRE